MGKGANLFTTRDAAAEFCLRRDRGRTQVIPTWRTQVRLDPTGGCVLLCFQAKPSGCERQSESLRWVVRKCGRTSSTGQGA